MQDAVAVEMIPCPVGYSGSCMQWTPYCEPSNRMPVAKA